MSKLGQFAAACAAVVVGFCAGAAWADPVTYWVATDGSDAPEVAGTEEAPFLTLTNAIAHAVDDDTIKLKAGTYDIPLAPGGVDSFWATVDAAVTIEGVGGASEVFLDGGQRNVTPLKLNNAGATVRGITFRNFKTNTTWNKYLAGLLHLTAGTVDSCVFTDSSCYYCGTVTMNGGTVTNCVFRNLESGDSNGWGAGVLLYSGSPLVTDCLFDNCRTKQGSAVYMQTDGTVRNCRMINCTAYASNRGYTGTVTLTKGVIEDCIITNNTATITTANTTCPGAAGVNIRGGTLRNCLVADNLAKSGLSGSVAGGVYLYKGTVESCTVCLNSINTPTYPGQGLLMVDGTLRNTIVAYNGKEGVFKDPVNFERSVDVGTVEYSCTYPLAAGEGNVGTDPLFDAEKGMGQLLAASDCVNAGTNQDWMVGVKDVFGNPRIYGEIVDIGCHELDLSDVPFKCIFQQDVVSGISPVTVSFVGKVIAAPGAVTTVVWDFGDGTTDSTSGLEATHEYEGFGIFDVKLTVTAGGETREYAVEGAVTSGTCKTYVATDGGNVWPYATPATAAQNLVDAVNALAFSNSTAVCEVEVAPGRYTVPPAANKDEAWVSVVKGVRIYSTEGPEKTFFDGGWNGTSASPVCFAFMLNNEFCSLEGFTIENLYSNTDYAKKMGGAIHAMAGTVSNCVIRHTNNFFEGPLSLLKATAYDCVISNNVMRDGWTQGSVTIRDSGKLFNSLIADNTGKEAPGLYQVGANSIVSNCVICGNTCLVTTRGDYGALWISNGTLVDSVVSNNLGLAGVVKMSGSCTVRNCLIADNTSEGSKAEGGGVTLAGGTLENCTVVGNVATVKAPGQGVLQTGGTVRNCVVAYNGAKREFANSDNFTKTGGTVEYSCVYPLADGTANRAADPQFNDVRAGDYTLMLTSPYRDMGLYAAWMDGAKDLEGNARVIGDGPEPGCYEIDPSKVPFSCSISLEGATLGLLPHKAKFTGTAVNPPGEVTAYEWDFGDGETGEGETVEHTYEIPGKFTVKLVVRSGDASAERVEVNFISAGCDHAYASPTGGHVWPYETEAKAATNIQDAIDAIILPDDSSKGTVYVLPGVYRLATANRKFNDEQDMVPRINLTRAIDVIGVGGPAVTVIDGGATPRDPVNSSACEMSRGIMVTHAKASFRGFTVCGVRSSMQDKSAAGTLEVSAGHVSNCVFTNNVGSWGATVGVRGGILENCQFLNNWTKDSAAEGGALRISSGEVRSCTFRNNSATYGAAVYSVGDAAVVSNCTISGNKAAVSRGLGGAAVDLVRGTLTHSTVTNNTGSAAGGVTTWNFYATNNGQIMNMSPVLRNCLIAGNTSTGYWGNDVTVRVGAGGVYHGAGTVENCTVVDNVANFEGTKAGDLMARRRAGATGETYELVNTIAWGSAVESTLDPALTQANNRVNEDPGFFRTAGKKAYRLSQSSPCRDAGTHAGRAWMEGATDLDGNPRIIGDEVDIGCYEYRPIGLMLLVR